MTCHGPDCDRDAEHLGLCGSHYRQLRRTGELKPIVRKRRDPLPVVSLRVSKETEKAVEEDYEGAVEALEKWAKRRER